MVDRYSLSLPQPFAPALGGIQAVEDLGMGLVRPGEVKPRGGHQFISENSSSLTNTGGGESGDGSKACSCAGFVGVII